MQRDGRVRMGGGSGLLLLALLTPETFSKLRAKPLHPHTPQQSPACKLARESSTFQVWKQEKLWFFFFLVACWRKPPPASFSFCAGPACDVSSWRYKQVNNEGQIPLQNKGLDFSLVHLEFDGWLFSRWMTALLPRGGTGLREKEPLL